MTWTDMELNAVNFELTDLGAVEDWFFIALFWIPQPVLYIIFHLFSRMQNFEYLNLYFTSFFIYFPECKSRNRRVEACFHRVEESLSLTSFFIPLCEIEIQTEDSQQWRRETRLLPCLCCGCELPEKRSMQQQRRSATAWDRRNRKNTSSVNSYTSRHQNHHHAQHHRHFHAASATATAAAAVMATLVSKLTVDHFPS